jgi:hypothetical protein
MKSQVLSFCFALLTASAVGQNLVPNGSFEENNGCPKTASQFYFCDYWTVFRGTPDYFHECSVYFAGVPNNLAAFQYPKDGVAYAGISGFWSVNPNWREHIGAELLESMVIGEIYYASFWLSKSDKLQTAIAHNNHGIRFSTYSNTSGDGAALPNWAHIYNEEFISDTANWVQIRGSFIADSAYTHIAIGNFFDDDHTSILLLDQTEIGEAHYLIDDVRVSTDSIYVFHSNVLENTVSHKINLYPNPARDYLLISSNADIYYWRMFNSQGTLVNQNYSNSRELMLPIKELSEGLYVILLELPNQNFISKQFIKIQKP